MSIPARVVLASSDLNAHARVLDAAGTRAVTTTPATAFSAHLDGAGILILDLDEGGSAALEELGRARDAGLLPPTVVGFLSHVDRDLGRRARDAGCRAISRGRFWGYLGELFSGPSS